MFIAEHAQTRLELQWLAPSSEGEKSDVLLAVELHRPNFSARNGSVWIAASARDRFLSDLSAMEKARRGEALLESMSPQDLKCCVRVYDHAGHVVMTGHVGDALVDREYAEIARVPFRIEIDPSTLPDLVRDLTATLRPPVA
jgi:hypothetical protein